MEKVLGNIALQVGLFFSQGGSTDDIEWPIMVAFRYVAELDSGERKELFDQMLYLVSYFGLSVIGFQRKAQIYWGDSAIFYQKFPKATDYFDEMEVFLEFCKYAGHKSFP